MSTSLFYTQIGEIYDMGKHTLYHPLSLNVIRGAAEYSGWKIGRITQLGADQSEQSAQYICDLDRLPGGASEWPIRALIGQFQHCFMDDITVKSMWCTPSGRWLARLDVRLDGGSDQNGDMA